MTPPEPEPASARAPRCGFVFESVDSHPPRASRRLADLVAGKPLDLDVETLAARVVFASPALGATPYRSVRARYERQSPVTAFPDGPRAVAEAPRALRRVMADALAHVLGDARRVAVLTGGGLDSGALLALTHDWARRTGGTVLATAIDFGGEGDDRPYLAALERHLGCEILRSRPEDAARWMTLVEEGVDASPLTWPGAAIEIEALARARDHGAEVVLTGIGADELFDGDPRSLARLARSRPFEALRGARRMRGFERPASPLFSWLVRPNLSAALSFARRPRDARPPSPSWAGPALVSFIEADPSSPSALSPWDAPHLEHLAWLRHQEDAAAGIECRSIFLEPSVRRFVRGLPPDWLLRGAIRRGLFREAVRDLLPSTLVAREDKARFEGGFAAWLEAAGGVARLRELASAERLAELGLVEPRAFGAAFEQAAGNVRDGDFWSVIWPALAVEAFLRARARTEGAVR